MSFMTTLTVTLADPDDDTRETWGAVSRKKNEINLKGNGMHLLVRRLCLQTWSLKTREVGQLPMIGIR